MPSLVVSNNQNRKAWRDKCVQAGFSWQGNTFQTRKEDRESINGAVARIHALISKGVITLDSGGYTNTAGNYRPFFWRSVDNVDVPFTAGEFLDFAIHLVEHIEDLYIGSWPPSSTLISEPV